MMKRILTAVMLTAMLLVSSTALAGTKTHRSAKVSFWLPDAWKTADESADQISVSDPKGEVGLLFLVRKAKDMKGALAAIDELLAQTAKDIQAGEPQKTKLNGMEASVVDATGKVDGVPVSLSVLVVKTPAKKFLIVLGVLETSKLKDHEANLTKILGSLKPVAAKFGG